MIPSKEAWDKVLRERHGKERQDKFEAATVAVCGLGGLGSNIAICLARAGVGKLVLIDFDQVDISNLHRQQYKVAQLGQYKTDALRDNLKEIAPYVEVKTHRVLLKEDNAGEILKEADIICEAFDQPEAKAMLTNLVLEKFPEKYLVAGSGMAGMKSGNLIQTKKITDHFYLCGDLSSDIADGMGLVSARVMICAAQEALVVLRLLAGEKDS